MSEDELIVHFFQLDGNLIISVYATFCLLRAMYDPSIKEEPCFSSGYIWVGGIGSNRVINGGRPKIHHIKSAYPPLNTMVLPYFTN